MFHTQLTNVTEIVEKNEKFAEKFNNLGAYALIVRGNEGFWNGTARKHYESLSKEFSGTLFVRKFLVSSTILFIFGASLNFYFLTYNFVAI